MSMLLKILKSSACRSNHHRLAIDALTQLRGTDGELWRNLFLHYYPDYLEGAKAPDEVFKDFKNHVLHVREGDWGGAPAAAREWYRRTVRALSQQDWKGAVYSAGVMSHYVVDPLQPFHTGQTEEEGIIHRAVEWSLSKSYDELQRILENDLGGYTDVPVPAGNDWLEQMVKTGAKVSNPHYETLIDHYNFEIGAKKPELGCDQEMKDVVAKLIGYATVLLARILEKAFVEAAVVPPKVGLTLDTIVASIKAPIRSVLAALDNEKERDFVRAMYNEFQKTGKVRQTLPEDDRQIRRLHAFEVLKVPLSTLDASWPRETGTAHGTGRPARTTKPVKAAKPKPAPKPHKARIEPTSATPDIAPAPKPAPKPQRVKPVAQAVEEAARTPMVAAPAPQPPAPPPAVQQHAASATTPGKLRHDSPVEQAPSIGPKTASRLEAIGIHTVEDLLAASPEDAANRLKFKHINARLIRDWQAQAALACSIPKLSSLSAQLMVAVGVRDTDDLASADPETLVNMIDEFCETPDGQRILRDGNPPEEDQIRTWVEAAQELLTRNAA
jgi:predicted flap endonuclease-1-like 5' DNA nuclease